MKTNRSYKRNKPYKDAVKIVIVSEGIKEKKYFEALNELFKSRKFVILPFPPEENRSAPNFAIDRIKKIIKDEELQTNDKIWLVFDIDKWQEKILSELHRTKKVKNIDVFLLLSNPCFEVWLWAHKFKLDEITSKKCKELKEEFHKKSKTGFNMNKLKFKELCNAYNETKNNFDSKRWKPKFAQSSIFKLLDYLFEIEKNKNCAEV